MKKFFKDTLIIIAVTLAMLALIELALRIFFPQFKHAGHTITSLAFEYNQDYLVALKPNMEKVFVRDTRDGGGKVTWKTDSLGFRGEGIGEKNAPRVIVYGDSNVHARFSPDHETYPAVLQQLIGMQIKGVQVINAGMTGAGPDQSLLRLREHFAKVSPDVVIFHIFADNDYGDIIKNRLFELSAQGEMVKTGFPVTVDPKLNPVRLAFNNLLNQLYLYGAVNSLLADINASRESQLSEAEKTENTLNELERNSTRAYAVYKQGKPREFSHFKDFYDIDIAADPDSESARTKIALMEKVLLAASQFCAEKKAAFMVVVQPSKLDLVGNWPENLARKYPKYRPENLTRPLKEICAKNRFNCIHLIDYYSHDDPASLYIADGHWSAKGQRVAAEETSREILRLSQSGKQ